MGATVGIGDPEPWIEDDCLLICIAGTDALKAAIERVAHRTPPHRVVLTSSTGFYNGLGGPLDETSEPGPSQRAQNIAECERIFRDWAGTSGTILRLGGLYRQGRGPLNALKKRGHVPYACEYLGSHPLRRRCSRRLGGARASGS